MFYVLSKHNLPLRIQPIVIRKAPRNPSTLYYNSKNMSLVLASLEQLALCQHLLDIFNLNSFIIKT